MLLYYASGLLDVPLTCSESMDNHWLVNEKYRSRFMVTDKPHLTCYYHHVIQICNARNYLMRSLTITEKVGVIFWPADQHDIHFLPNCQGQSRLWHTHASLCQIKMVMLFNQANQAVVSLGITRISRNNLQEDDVIGLINAESHGACRLSLLAFWSFKDTK